MESPVSAVPTMPFEGADAAVENPANSSQDGRTASVFVPSDHAAEPGSRVVENQLLQVRLGIASSLFTALRCRSSHAAAHSLRVTLSCASWAMHLGMSDEQRDIIEVAALLHDIGKIGAPDNILLKPGPLSVDETVVLEQHRRHGVTILRCSCAHPAILDIVHYASAWYDGSKSDFELSGAALPLGARMLAIADAFDSMTADQPYRRALPRERAFHELFRHAGTQFDPELIKLFADLHERDPGRLHEQVAQRWLMALDHQQSNSLWRLNPAAPSAPPSTLHPVFQQNLMDNMRDMVVFVDASLRVIQWNAGAERLTNISATSIQERRFSPRLLDMRDHDGVAIPDEQCPVADGIQSGEQRLKRFVIRGRGRKDVAVEAHVVPVVGGDGVTHGATLVMRDVSPELSLEARCASLHEMATKDLLTRMANRAEFERVHSMFVATHLERQLPYSLILADIDQFKHVNDTYGHPAGDEVLKVVAKVLRGSCRSGELVARYGGEEFVMLCADCDNATAARRAEDIRQRISRVLHAALHMQRVTASFGVTEIQPGDTPATMLARADRALYEAKAHGRNTVVQLGAGLGGGDVEGGDRMAVEAAQLNRLAQQELVTAVPISVAIEKLRGFVSDQQAEILSIDQRQVQLRMGGNRGFFFRRRGDRQIPLLVDLRFLEDAAAGGSYLGRGRTRIHVEIRTQRTRDRRKSQALHRARQLMTSFRAYLMASDGAI
jgi:diguanylate cyclase (GGDEF)-like protein